MVFFLGVIATAGAARSIPIRDEIFFVLQCSGPMNVMVRLLIIASFCFYWRHTLTLGRLYEQYFNVGISLASRTAAIRLEHVVGACCRSKGNPSGDTVAMRTTHYLQLYFSERCTTAIDKASTAILHLTYNAAQQPSVVQFSHQAIRHSIP